MTDPFAVASQLITGIPLPTQKTDKWFFHRTAIHLGNFRVEKHNVQKEDSETEEKRGPDVSLLTNITSEILRTNPAIAFETRTPILNAVLDVLLNRWAPENALTVRDIHEWMKADELMEIVQEVSKRYKMQSKKGKEKEKCAEKDEEEKEEKEKKEEEEEGKMEFTQQKDDRFLERCSERLLNHVKKREKKMGERRKNILRIMNRVLRREPIEPRMLEVAIRTSVQQSACKKKGWLRRTVKAVMQECVDPQLALHDSRGNITIDVLEECIDDIRFVIAEYRRERAKQFVPLSKSERRMGLEKERQLTSGNEEVMDEISAEVKQLKEVIVRATEERIMMERERKRKMNKLAVELKKKKRWMNAGTRAPPKKKNEKKMVEKEVIERMEENEDERPPHLEPMVDIEDEDDEKDDVDVVS